MTEEAIETPFDWLRANGHDTAPLTGQDRRAILAIDACWELYCAADTDGRRAALAAVAYLLGGMQVKCWPLAKALIPRAMDWPDEDPTWTSVIVMRQRLGLSRLEAVPR